VIALCGAVALCPVRAKVRGRRTRSSRSCRRRLRPRGGHGSRLAVAARSTSGGSQRRCESIQTSVYVGLAPRLPGSFTIGIDDTPRLIRTRCGGHGPAAPPPARRTDPVSARGSTSENAAMCRRAGRSSRVRSNFGYTRATVLFRQSKSSIGCSDAFQRSSAGGQPSTRSQAGDILELDGWPGR